MAHLAEQLDRLLGSGQRLRLLAALGVLHRQRPQQFRLVRAVAHLPCQGLCRGIGSQGSSGVTQRSVQVAQVVQRRLLEEAVAGLTGAAQRLVQTVQGTLGLVRGQSGTPCYFVNERGQILMYMNNGAVKYSGVGGGPNFDAALSVAGDMRSALAINGTASVDGNLWVVVR